MRHCGKVGARRGRREQGGPILEFAIRAAQSDAYADVLTAVGDCIRALQPNAEFALYSMSTFPELQLAAGTEGAQVPFAISQCLGATTRECHFFSHSAQKVCESLGTSLPAFCIPISSGELLAVLHLWRLKQKDAERQRFNIMCLAQIAAENLRKLAALKSAQSEARTDSLTGLATLRVFKAALAQEFSYSQANNSFLTLVLLDLDRLRGYNKKFGHPAANRLLAHFGKLLQCATRQGGLAARIGGDEFALLWPNVGLEEALRRADQIRNQTRRLSQLPSTAAIGVSAGVAERSSSSSSFAMRFEELADAALYLAKDTGRNRIAFATTDGCLELFQPRFRGVPRHVPRCAVIGPPWLWGRLCTSIFRRKALCR